MKDLSPLPVTVIGGYLGSGKTTLINHALRHADGQRLAVLVNEFGALSIDEDLIVGQSDGVVSIAGGCICCSFGDNLMGALMDLAGMTPAPDHIVIEASGVAIPSSIAASLSLLQGFALNAIVVLVDSDAVLTQARDPYIGDTITRQLTDADLILLTKEDLGVAPEVGRWLAEITPGAKVVSTEWGRVPLEVLLGPRSSGDLPSVLAHSDGAYESLVLRPEFVADPDALAVGLAEGGFGVLRAKGFVRHPGGVALIQVVGRRWDVRPADAAETIGVVVIGLKEHLDTDGVTQQTS